MESSQTPITITLKKQIQDYDNQILALKELKKEAQEKFNEELPSALEIIKNKKRKISEKVEGDFACLKDILAQDNLFSKGKENINQRQEENTTGIKKIVKIKRNVYSDQTKKMLVDYIEEYGYSEVKRRKGIPKNSLKTIKKKF